MFKIFSDVPNYMIFFAGLITLMFLMTSFLVDYFFMFSVIWACESMFCGTLCKLFETWHVGISLEKIFPFTSATSLEAINCNHYNLCF